MSSVFQGRHEVRMESVMHVRQLRMMYNPKKAKARAEARAQKLHVLPTLPTADLSTFNPCIKQLVAPLSGAPANLSSSCGLSGGGPALAWPETPLEEPACPSNASVERTGSGTRSVMLAHGFSSNACAWQYISAQISADGRVRAANLPWKNSYSFQADVLRQSVAASMPSGSPFILIGHSQGGMISRLAAERGPGQVRGVITIGTPNRGAPFARDWWKFGLALTGTAGILIPRFGPLVSRYIGTSVSLTKLAQCQVGPVLGGSICDANPDGGTIAGINSPSNPFIPGAAVIHHAGNDRLFYRMAGDFACGGCGSQLSSAVTGIYRTSIACTVVGGLFSILWPPLLNTALDCALVWGSIDALDWAWQASVSGGDTSDGFIPVASQQWPNLTASGLAYTETKQYRVPNGATHAGELRDARTVGRIDKALQDVFP